MDIGIGLPSTLPGTTPGQLVQWAVAAEERGFSSLGVIDRLVYQNTEPLVTLAAAATVTRRIRLMTSILIAPLRVNATLLAKQAATVNHLAGGRLVLGLAVGGYEDDYVASGVPFRERGRRFDAMLDEMTRVWAGEPRGVAGAVGPAASLGRSQLIFGGASEAAFTRVAAWGTGWIAGSRGLGAFREGAGGVRRAWAEHGRQGKPRLMALPYFALGPTARSDAAAYLKDFYAVEGPDAASSVLSNALTDADAVRDAATAFEDAGCDELLLFPCNADPQEVHRLADATQP